MSARARDALLLSAVTLLPLFVYHRVWLGPASEIAHFWADAPGSYWPDLAFFARTVGAGELPLWCPTDRGGFPFAFDPQPGVLYPLNWLFVLPAAIAGKAPFWLLQLKLLVHPMLAAAAWFGWLRARHASPVASGVGAIAGSLGVFTLQQVHFSLAWPLSYVPLALWAIDALLERATWLKAFGLAAALGAMFSAGSPPAAFYGAIVIASYAVVRGVSLRRALRENWRTALPIWGAAGGIALVLALPVLWGGSMLTAESVLRERSFEYVSSGAITPEALPHLLLPTSWSGLPLYVGVSVVALALAGLIGRAPNPIALWALAVAAIGLLLALGDTTPVLRWAIALVPPVRLFRGPTRYIYLTQVGLAVLAALGTDALVARTRVAKWMRRSLLAGALLIVLATLAHAALRQAFWRPDAGQIPLWLALLAVSAAIARTRRGRAFALTALVIVVALDLGAAAPRAGALRKGRFELAAKVSPPEIQKLLAETPNKRVWDEFALGFRSGSRLGLRDLRGYMDPLRLRRYGSMVDALKRNPNLIARYNVHYVLHAPHPYHGVGHNHVSPARLAATRVIEPNVLELSAAEPVASWVNHVQWVDDEAQVWTALSANPRLPGTIVQRADAPDRLRAQIDQLAATAAPERKPARVIEHRSNRLRLEVDAPAAGILVVNEAWFPHWHARVDGSDAEVFPVDGWVRGVLVGAGRHEVELVFRPTLWLLAAGAAVLAWLALGAFGIRALVQRVRKRRASIA